MGKGVFTGIASTRVDECLVRRRDEGGIRTTIYLNSSKFLIYGFLIEYG